MAEINEVYIQKFAPSHKKKLLILDRDGTLNKDTGYEHRKENLSLLPGVIEFLSKAASLDFGLVLATNQGGAALGKFSIDQSLEFTAALASLLAMNGIVVSAAYICFHHPFSSNPEKRVCSCRKPLPGMLTQALLDYGIEKRMVFMVGDKKTDHEASVAAGIEFRRIGKPHLWDSATRFLGEY